MYGVNLDLLQTTPHHADGRPRDPHARHRAEHCAQLRAARRARWIAAIAALVRVLRHGSAKVMPAAKTADLRH